MRLIVIDRDGLEHQMETATAGSLMETLRDLDYGVAAICGGSCSCASCHVYVDERWSGHIRAAHGDERELLDGLDYRAANSRLSCQIDLVAALDGLRVTLAPEE